MTNTYGRLSWLLWWWPCHMCFAKLGVVQKGRPSWLPNRLPTRQPYMTLHAWATTVKLCTCENHFLFWNCYLITYLLKVAAEFSLDKFYQIGCKRFMDCRCGSTISAISSTIYDDSITSQLSIGSTLTQPECTTDFSPFIGAALRCENSGTSGLQYYSKPLLRWTDSRCSYHSTVPWSL